MLYSTLDISEHLLLSNQTVRNRIKEIGLTPLKLKPNNTHYFTIEQVELIKENTNHTKTVINFFENVYYIYESKMNK